MKSKTCGKCKVVKTKDNFYKASLKPSGFDSYCKDCRRKHNKKNFKQFYGKNRDKVLEQQREYSKTEKGKIKSRNNQKKMYLKHRDKFNARYKVHEAIKKGLIIKKPCGICGKVKVEAHHEDYSKPLEVIWLCQKHHRILEGRWFYIPTKDWEKLKKKLLNHSKQG